MHKQNETLRLRTVCSIAFVKAVGFRMGLTPPRINLARICLQIVCSMQSEIFRFENNGI